MKVKRLEKEEKNHTGKKPHWGKRVRITYGITFIYVYLYVKHLLWFINIIEWFGIGIYIRWWENFSGRERTPTNSGGGVTGNSIFRLNIYNILFQFAIEIVQIFIALRSFRLASVFVCVFVRFCLNKTKLIFVIWFLPSEISTFAVKIEIYAKFYLTFVIKVLTFNRILYPDLKVCAVIESIFKYRRRYNRLPLWQ